MYNRSNEIIYHFTRNSYKTKKIEISNNHKNWALISADANTQFIGKIPPQIWLTVRTDSNQTRKIPPQWPSPRQCNPYETTVWVSRINTILEDSIIHITHGSITVLLLPYEFHNSYPKQLRKFKEKCDLILVESSKSAYVDSVGKFLRPKHLIALLDSDTIQSFLQPNVTILFNKREKPNHVIIKKDRFGMIHTDTSDSTFL